MIQRREVSYHFIFTSYTDGEGERSVQLDSAGERDM